MGYSWIKLTQDEFRRKGAEQSFALALIVMMFAGVFAFIMPAPAAADSWTDTLTENFALGTHENTENVIDNVRLENIGIGIYYTQGRFTSQAFNAGQVVENWDNISWNVTTPSLTKQENDNVGAEPTTLIDGDSRIGVVQTGTYEDTRDNDGVYESIQENNLGAPITNSYYEAVTVVMRGDNLSSPDKLDADDGDNYQVSAGASAENADYYMTLEPGPLVDGENSRIGVITGGSITDVQTQNNVYENIRENNLGAPTTTQENAAVTVVVSGDNLSTPDKLNVDDGDNYRVDAASIQSGEDVLIENGDFTNNPAASGWENTVTDLGGNEIGRVLWDSGDGFVSGHALGRGEDWSILWYQDFSVITNPENVILKFDWRPAVVVLPQEAHIKVILKSPSAVETTIWTKDYSSSATPYTAWTTQENDVTSIINETGTWRIILQSDLYTGSSSNAEWRWDWDDVQSGVTYALGVQHDSGTFSIPAGATIENVRVRLNFGSDDTVTYTLEIRDWQNSEWDILNTGTVASGTEVTWDNTLTTGPDDYISSNDNIRVRLRTDNTTASDHISKEDYLQFYVGYRPPEYGLRWEHRVTELPANGTAYIRIYGYADTGENFGIYTWDGTNDHWVYSGEDLPSGAVAEGWVEYSVPSSYREGDNLSIMYLSADNTDATPENIHIDYAGVRVTAPMYSIDVQHDSEPVSYSGILNNIHVRLNVRSENTATYTLQIRDWQNSEWDNLGTVVINNGAEYTFDNTLTVDPEYYTSTTDNIRVRLITATTENDHIVHEDYLVYEVNYTPADYALRWEHRIENIATSYDNFWVRVRGYTSGDSEKVGVYIWDNNASSWEFLDNLTTTEKTITKQMTGSDIIQYLRGDNLSIKYEDYDNTDDNQTTVHIDLCIVQAENFYTTEIKFQVATSTDNNVWSDNLGPDGTVSTYFTTSPMSLGNIGDNRYFRYIAYFSTEYNTITSVLHDVTINYTLPLPVPDATILYLPADGAYTNDNTPYFEWTVGANVDNHRLLVDNDSDFSSPEENVLLGAADNTYTISAGLADENYSWKVLAINAVGENESSTWTFVIDTIGPSIPTPYLPADGTVTNDNTVYFEWSSIADAENYDLFVDNDSDFSSPEVSVTITDNFYTSSALADENYSWRVRARDAANNVSDNSATWTFLVDVTAPAAPTLVLPSDGAFTNDNTPVFDWSDVTDPSGVTYDLWVDNDADFSSPEISRTSLTESTFTPTAELAEENYSWRVRAVDGATNIGDNSATWTFLVDVTAPAQVTLYLPENNAVLGSLTVSFEWYTVTDSSGVTYTIQIDNEASFSAPLVHENTAVNDNTYSYTLPSDGDYYWRVRAVGGAGNPGAWADNFTFTVAVWRLIETWTGTVTAPAEWNLIGTWTSTVSAPAQWQLIETWTGTVQAPAEWQVIETWTGTVQAPVAWQLIETWTGTVQAPAEWQVIETWMGTVSAPAEWQLIETWTGTVEAPAAWQLIESWTGTVSAPVAWQLVETWTGTVEAPAAWQLVESWTGTVEAPAEWQLIETWTGTIEAPAEWQLIETWTGTVEAPVVWQLIETWAGTVQAPAEWQLIESWTGTVEAPAAWQLIETWTGTINAPTEWQLVEFWTSVVRAPVPEWHLIESWTSVVKAPVLKWRLIEIWTGVVKAPVVPPPLPPPVVPPPLPPPVVPPTSSVDAITPYWRTSTPFTIIATASDPNGIVESVTLWYCYSSDNSSWTAWIFWGTDISSPWEWSFNAPAGDSFYEFYSVAEDDDGNVEAAPATADAQCGVDTTAPSAPYFISPVDAGKLTDATPVFDWTEVEDLSGVTYELMIDDSFDFSSPVLNRTGLATSTYALSADEALSEGTYYSRVRAADGAGNLDSWSSTRSFTIEVVVPPTPAPLLMPIFYALLTTFATLGVGFVAYIRWFRLIPPAISLKWLRRVAMRGRRKVKMVEVRTTDIATLLERLRDTTSVEKVGRPIAPLLEGFERAVVWKPKPVKVRITKAGRADVERFGRLWRAAKSNYSGK